MKTERTTILALLLLLISLPAYSQKTFEMDIWPDGLPNTNGTDLTKPYDDNARNYKPMITVFLPAKDKATGRAVVCCPGGAYEMLALESEGTGWASFFNDRGIALIVLKYRMPHGFSSVPATDADEAIRITRRHAKEWNIDPHKVGIMGHSAGGHLASTVATHAVGDAKPDFQILLYPVITMDPSYTHIGSRNNLIGQNPSPEIEHYYCNEKQVRPGDPTAFIALSNDDNAVQPANGANYYLALQKAGVKASLHIYPDGGHGYGSMPSFRWHKQLEADLTDWLATLP